MVEKKNFAHAQALSMLKVQGIIAIVFGSLGVLLGLLFMVIFVVALSQAYSNNDVIEFFAAFVATLLFVFIPHIYLIISGAILVRQPEPRLARILTIINLVVGALSNYVMLAFAIISLTQSKDYEDGYRTLNKE